MEKILIQLGIFCLILLGNHIGRTQSNSGKIKYEVNGVVESTRFISRDITPAAVGSSVQSFGYFGAGGNVGIEIGMSYLLHERHILTGRIGGYHVSTSAALLDFDTPLPVAEGSPKTSLPIVYKNQSARLELSHRYFFYDKGKVQFSLNSGVGLRYWSWNQTSEITYFDFSDDPNPIGIGEYTSYSIRPLHPDLNLGLSLVLREFFKNIDLCTSFSYLWHPLNAFRVDPLRFRDGAGIENQLQFNNKVNLWQLRVGFIFSLDGNKNEE